MAKQQSKHIQKEVSKPKTKATTQGPSFLSFLIDKAQWLDWALIGGLSIAIFILLKVYYPYPMTETDSGNYILSAANGKINGYRPYGYSSFLSFFHGLSSDIKFVVTWQWLLTFLSTAYFLFSVKFMFRSLSRIAFYILCIAAILNPSVIFMDAYMMSDSLFLSLTLAFLTSCMWVVYSRSWAAMIACLLLMWWCMDTRYIGLFYPVFAAGALIWALWSRFRWLSMAAGLLPLLLLYFYRADAADKMKEEFGVETFSSFGGWQKANNATAVLPYVKVDPNEITDPQVRSIHQIVRQFPDSCFNTESVMATSFMWVKQYPGKQCLFQYIQQTNTPYMKAWAYMGTQMEAYGDFLQTRYRSEYFSHFIMPNFKNIFEVFEISDLKDFGTDANMKGFFAIDRDSYHYSSHMFRSMTGLRRIGDILVWLLLFASVIAGAIMHRRLNWTIEQKLIALSMVLFIVAFCAASVIAAPINNFRYIMPIYYCQLLIPVLVLSAMAATFRKSDS